jgi:hypothetical protein
MAIDRRMLLGAVAATGLSWRSHAQTRDSLPRMVVNKDPGCGCCTGWVEHIRASGFAVEVVDTRDLASVRRRLGVPADLTACHSAELGEYVIEGHVPAAAIKKLLAERPVAKGLAVPGMPIGSPGMEMVGQPDEDYEVILFGPAGQQPFARFRGQQQI